MYRKPTTAGEILQLEFIEPLNITQTKLAEHLGVKPGFVNEIVKNRRAITAITALMLSKALNTTPAFWLNLQAMTDIWEAENAAKSSAKIDLVEPVLEMA